ncbi:MAG: tRNA-binding protein [Desulfovibrionaceae bacterium]
MTTSISYAEFEQVDMRIGLILRAEPFPKARKPAYRLWIDFGEELGIKKSSAQVTEHYHPEDLQGRLVVAVVNFPPRQIADFMSEVLCLGVDGHGNSGVVLLEPERDVPLGSRIY